MANDRKPGFRGPDFLDNERFPEDREDIKNIGGDPLDETKRDDTTRDGANEGEGNKSADRRYREGVAKTIRSGQVEKKRGTPNARSTASRATICAAPRPWARSTATAKTRR